MCLCLLSICFWRASLKKQNRKIHWHFESWIHRRCCLQCAENIRFKQPEQAWCQAVLLWEKGGLRQSFQDCLQLSSCCLSLIMHILLRETCLNPQAPGEPQASLLNKGSSPGHPRAKAKTIWRLKESGAFEDWIWENSLGRKLECRSLELPSAF